MKKLVIGLMTLALTVGLSLSVMAGVGTPTGQPLPAGSVEHEAWYLDEYGVWVSMGTGDLGANARAWSSNPKTGICNKFSWGIPVIVHASVAQWLEYSLSGTRYDWRVRKPGIYAGDSLTAILTSNSDLEIDFDGFGNLMYQGTAQFPGVTQEIETWYAYGEGPPDTLVWMPAIDLDATDHAIKDSADLHAGYSFKLWNKIKVVASNSASEYEDNATITLVLQNQKIWIAADTGKFKM